jgi:hypothetical protein
VMKRRPQHGHCHTPLRTSSRIVPSRTPASHRAWSRISRRSSDRSPALHAASTAAVVQPLCGSWRVCLHAWDGVHDPSAAQRAHTSALATIHGRAAVLSTHHATTSLWAVIAATMSAVCARVCVKTTLGTHQIGLN